MRPAAFLRLQLSCLCGRPLRVLAHLTTTKTHPLKALLLTFLSSVTVCAEMATAPRRGRGRAALERRPHRRPHRRPRAASPYARCATGGETPARLNVLLIEENLPLAVSFARRRRARARSRVACRAHLSTRPSRPRMHGTGTLSIVCCDPMIVFLLPLYVIMSITRPISIPISSFVRHGAEKSRGRKTTTVYEFIRRGTGKRSVRPTVGSGWDLAGTMVIGCHAWVKKCTRGLFQKRLRSLARLYGTAFSNRRMRNTDQIQVGWHTMSQPEWWQKQVRCHGVWKAHWTCPGALV